jgi:hypothetical protein
MSRSFALVTLFVSSSLVCAFSSQASSQEPSAPASAQDPAAANNPAPGDSTKPAPKKKKVWTNENLGDANGTISVVGDPDKPSVSKPDVKSGTAPAKPADANLVAALRKQALALQAQLDKTDKELSDLKNFSRGDSTGSGGLKTTMDYTSASVDDQIRDLTKKRKQLQASLDSVFDAARSRGIEPGQLR